MGPSPNDYYLLLLSRRMKITQPKMASKNRQPKRPLTKAARTRTVTAPLARATVQSTPRPNIQTGKAGTTIITHTEYITDIIAADSAYGVDRLPINPGLEGTFPWLSTIATRFEYYRFKNLRFEYRSVCPATTAGTVYMAVDYDASDPTPQNKQSFMAYDGAIRSSPWTDFDLKTSNANMKAFTAERFTRAANVANDIKTYDVGNFFIATANTVVPNVLFGELYVHYTVELRAPQLGVSSIGEKPNQFGTLGVDAGGNAVHRATIFNTLGKALVWINSVVDNDNHVDLNLIVQGLQSPALFKITGGPGWSYPGATLATAITAPAAVLQSWNSDAGGRLAGISALPFKGLNSRDTGAALDLSFIIGQRSYQSNPSRSQLPLTLTWNKNQLNRPAYFANNMTLQYTITPIVQSLVDNIIGPLDPLLVGPNDQIWNYPPLIPPDASAILANGDMIFEQSSRTRLP